MSRWGVLVLGAISLFAWPSPAKAERLSASLGGVAAVLERHGAPSPGTARSTSSCSSSSTPTPAASSTATTRNFIYDSYPGVRVGTTGTWLNGVPPVVMEYLPGTGIVHSMRSFSGFQIDEYDFSPMGLSEYASLMLVQVTQTRHERARSMCTPSSTTSSAPGEPHARATTPRSSPTTPPATPTTRPGPSGVAMAYASLLPSTYHGCTPNNPFGLLNAGVEPRTTIRARAGRRRAPCPGFQSSLGTLATNTDAWVGWITVLAPDANGPAAVDRVRRVDRRPHAGQAPLRRGRGLAVVDDAAAERRERRSRRRWPPGAGRPAHGTGDRRRGARAGQILASVAPGQWNISWVRDMAYAVVGLVRSGHYAEAKAAIAFQMGAQVGTYESYVGRALPDQRGSLLRRRHRVERLEQRRAQHRVRRLRPLPLGARRVRARQRRHRVARRLVAHGEERRSPTCWWACRSPRGSSRADSSIWEVHWDGQQKHFAYTTIAAANGLCSASRLAQAAGDTASVGDVPRRRTEGATPRSCRTSARPTGRSPRAPSGSPPARAGSTRRCSRPSTSGSSIRRGTRRSATLASIENGLVPAERPRLHAQRHGRRLLVERVGVHRPARGARDRAPRRRELRHEPVRVERRPGQRQLRRALRAARSGHRRLRRAGARWSASARARTCCGSPTAASRSRRRAACSPSSRPTPVDAGADAAAPGEDGGSGDAGESGDAGTPGGEPDASAMDAGHGSDGGPVLGGPGKVSSGGCGCVVGSPADGAGALLAPLPPWR